MKVVLLQDVPKVGKKNELKEVSDGFARNFLFTKKFAAPATESILKNLETQKRREEREASAELKKYQIFADKLKSLELTFKVKMGEKGKAFGSVSAAKIREELSRRGINIEREAIMLEDTIKTSGRTPVKIKFPGSLTGEIIVNVEAE